MELVKGNRSGKFHFRRRCCSFYPAGLGRELRTHPTIFVTTHGKCCQSSIDNPGTADRSESVVSMKQPN